MTAARLACYNKDSTGPRGWGWGVENLFKKMLDFWPGLSYYNSMETLNKLIKKAIDNPENRNVDGSINWNFVSADIHLDNQEQNLGLTDEQLFHGLENYNG